MDTKDLSDEERTINRQLKRRIDRLIEPGLQKRKKETLPKLEVTKESPERKKEISKCFKCGKKLRITNYYVCKCGNAFCPLHRFFDQHNCPYDIKGMAIMKLKEENPQVVNKKITEF